MFYQFTHLYINSESINKTGIQGRHLTNLPCIPLPKFILHTRWAKVDTLNIVTEFPCLLGLTVYTPGVTKKNET